MRFEPLAWLRRKGGCFSALALGVLVLPVLLGLLQTPAGAAQAQLLADIAASRCLPGGEDGPATHDGHGDCCIVCAAAALANFDPRLASAPAYDRALGIRAMVPAETAEHPPRSWSDLRLIVPRGPPAI